MPKQKTDISLLLSASLPTLMYTKSCLHGEFIFSCVIITLRNMHLYSVTSSHIIWFADIYRDCSSN